MTQVGTGSAKYFIAIDFGTHGSGFAYTSVADSDSAVKTFEYWPGQRGSPAPKTRTALLYKRSSLAKPEAWGWEAVSMYGDLPEEERGSFILLESFKLYLMPEDFQGLPQLPAGLTIRYVGAVFSACSKHCALTWHYAALLLYVFPGDRTSALQYLTGKSRWHFALVPSSCSNVCVHSTTTVELHMSMFNVSPLLYFNCRLACKGCLTL